MSANDPCREYVAQVHSFIDGELTEAECAALKAHLEDCPPCLDEYQRDALLKKLVQRSCRCEQAPQELRTQIMARISVQIVTVELADE